MALDWDEDTKSNPFSGYKPSLTVFNPNWRRDNKPSSLTVENSSTSFTSKRKAEEDTSSGPHFSFKGDNKPSSDKKFAFKKQKKRLVPTFCNNVCNSILHT